jgi:hypothetical protein
MTATVTETEMGLFERAAARAIVAARAKLQSIRRAVRMAILEEECAIEAYVFSLNPTQFSGTPGLFWGTPNGWSAHKNPQVAFRPERLSVNTNFPGVVYLMNIQAADVEAQIGGVADAFSFSPLAVGTKLSLPTLPPSNTMQAQGTWTGFIPPSQQRGASFELCLDFQGWAHRKKRVESLPQPVVAAPPSVPAWTDGTPPEASQPSA